MYHVWPALMAGGDVVVKGEAVTRRSSLVLRISFSRHVFRFSAQAKDQSEKLLAGLKAHAGVSAFAVEQKSQQERQPGPLSLSQPRTQPCKFLIRPVQAQSGPQLWFGVEGRGEVAQHLETSVQS